MKKSATASVVLVDSLGSVEEIRFVEDLLSNWILLLHAPPIWPKLSNLKISSPLKTLHLISTNGEQIKRLIFEVLIIEAMGSWCSENNGKILEPCRWVLWNTDQWLVAVVLWTPRGGGYGGFVVGVGWLVCLCLASIWLVGFVDDFGLGCDLGFVCVWSRFVIWVFVCIWSPLLLLFFFFGFVLFCFFFYYYYFFPVCVLVIWFWVFGCWIWFGKKMKNKL